MVTEDAGAVTGAPDGNPDLDEEDVIGEPVTTPNIWTAAAQLLHQKDDATVMVDVPVPVKVPLRGADLRAFTEREQAARQEQAAAREQVRWFCCCACPYA